MSEVNGQKNYIENVLIKQICEKFDNEKLVDVKIQHSGGLDGFMSVLYTIDIKTFCAEKNEEKLHKLIAKFMKEDESFRRSTKSYIQFPNEIFIYSKVLPYYEQIIAKSKSLSKVKDWIPEVYTAKYGPLGGEFHNNRNESILVMENINPLGYRCSPKYDLNRQHLLLCVKLLAQYHSMTYALRIKNDPKLQELIKEIIPLPFSYDSFGDNNKQLPKKKPKISNDDENINSLDDETNFYKILYRLAFDRFYNYLDQIEAKQVKEDNAENSNLNLFKDLNILRVKYFEKPENLLEFIRLAAPNDPNDLFPVILHGDYNRNNVLFQYDPEDISFENPKNIKMIDFQELRYGTPAIDLSFLMYINMDSSLRESNFWMELLKIYHDTVIKSLMSVLSIEVDDECLKPYSFDRFYEHFSKYAFYGVLICLHFLPWKVSNSEELEKLATLFANDIHGEEFRKISMECGGNVPDKLNFDIVKHAHRMGYVKNLL